MRVFISWSGERSNAVASALHEWIPSVLNYIDPWVSDQDIAAGDRWFESLANVLENSTFGIVCLTKCNLDSPWLHFEAGALAKVVSKSQLIPLLIDADPSEISGPLSQFQAKKICEKEILDILKAINAQSDSTLEEKRLLKQFQALWPVLDKTLVAISSSSSSQEPSGSRFRSAPRLGGGDGQIQTIVGSDEFHKHLMKCLRRTTKSLVQVGSGFNCQDEDGASLARQYLRVLTGCALRHHYIRIEMADRNMQNWIEMVSRVLAPMKNVSILVPSDGQRETFLLRDLAILDAELKSAVVELMIPKCEPDPQFEGVVEKAGEYLFLEASGLARALKNQVFELTQKGFLKKVNAAELREHFSIPHPDPIDQNDTVVYFAFGSNMLGDQMMRRMETAAPIGTARLDKYNLVFDIPGTIFDASVANIEPGRGEVWGVAYRVAREELIRRMDFYEGLEQGEYKRVEIQIEIDGDKSPQSAFVYLNPSTGNGTGRPALDYIQRMVLGASQHGLPQSYIRYLQKLANKRMPETH